MFKLNAQTEAIPKTLDRQKTLHEELNAVADKSMSRSRGNIAENNSMAGKHEELKIAFNNMCSENRQLHNRLDEIPFQVLEGRLEDFVAHDP